VDAAALLETLRNYRKRYTEMSLEHMRAPDGSYEGGAYPSASSHKANVPNLETNNPLSLHNEVTEKSRWSGGTLLRISLEPLEAVV
jgi:TBC1 domain family member 5